MSDYGLRILTALLGSELLPASLRTKIMRAVGFPIAREVCIWPQCNFRSKKVRIQPEVFINVGFYHDGYDMLEIGEHVRIGPHVRIITATHAIGPAWERAPTHVEGAPVRIGDGCWIGAGAIILPGVTIANGCVVGALSVVTASTEADGLYVGNPARRIQDLPPDPAPAMADDAAGRDRPRAGLPPRAAPSWTRETAAIG